MKDQLTDQEKEIFAKVRAFGEAEILPIVNDYWERGEFPFELIPKIAALNIVGDHNLGDYGCTRMSAVANGLITYELSRVDGSICTFFGVHVGLAMQSINILGSEEQRQHYLPAMARLEKIGAFALTEPEHGSDAVVLEATDERHGDEWVLNGRKRWPGNAVWCDIIVAQRLGLVQQVVAHDELLPTADEWCARVAAMPAHAVAMTKPLLRAAADARWQDALRLEEFAEPTCFTTAAFADNVHAMLTR
jgi:alkylation response protein AidB-like acyl-CoA dehydrogenase